MIPVLFILITFLILASGYFYVGFRVISQANLSPVISIVLWCVLVLLLLFLYVPFVSARLGYSGKISDGLLLIGYVGLGFISFLIIILLIKDIVTLIFFLLKKVRFIFKPSGEISVVDPERRQFLHNLFNAGIIGTATVLTGYGFYHATKKPYVKKVFIPVKNFKESLVDFKIVQVSDLHVGPTIKRKYVQAIVDEVNKINPDVFVFTGDLVDGSVENLKYDVEPLKNINPKFGKFFITGNHEYYSGALDWMKEAENLGFTVLHNENRLVDYFETNILFAGVPDVQGVQFYKDHFSDPIKAIENSEQSDIKILLAHQPKSLYKAIEAGFDIQLSGHTHGGQFIPWNFLAKIGQPFIKGLNKLQNTWIYVSNGTGYWGPPLRIGAKSEITLIKFRNE
jgi:predicted MPP superfamily phosphohydrolase